ncbi:MAG: transcriptional regulator [Alphaproteobacteria bacterium HGW-Alphaproteobacteria-2]|nr:MAG: transcriptional regulator [Alphaproteobacteria bacterium HGW-Alphaproteobacteria-2]
MTPASICLLSFSRALKSKIELVQNGISAKRYFPLGAGVTKSLRTESHIALTAALTAARRDSGLTQQELAARLGRSQSFVAKIELGERRVEVVELVEIARILDVPTARLIAPVEAVLQRGS